MKYSVSLTAKVKVDVEADSDEVALKHALDRDVTLGTCWQDALVCRMSANPRFDGEVAHARVFVSMESENG